MRRLLTWAPLIIMIGILCFNTEGLPLAGDPSSPASSHVSPHYIKYSEAETGVPNFVGAILADYRGYDTLGENIVIFTAGLSTVLILKGSRGKRGKGK